MSRIQDAGRRKQEPIHEAGSQWQENKGLSVLRHASCILLNQGIFYR